MQKNIFILHSEQFNSLLWLTSKYFLLIHRKLFGDALQEGMIIIYPMVVVLHIYGKKPPYMIELRLYIKSPLCLFLFVAYGHTSPLYHLLVIFIVKHLKVKILSYFIYIVV